MSEQKISLGDVAWAASLVKNRDQLLALPIRNLNAEQAWSWPLCGIVEREPSKSSRWRMTTFGLAVRDRIQKDARSAPPPTTHAPMRGNSNGEG